MTDLQPKQGEEEGERETRSPTNAMLLCRMAVINGFGYSVTMGLKCLFHWIDRINWELRSVLPIFFSSDHFCGRETTTSSCINSGNKLYQGRLVLRGSISFAPLGFLCFYLCREKSPPSLFPLTTWTLGPACLCKLDISVLKKKMNCNQQVPSLSKKHVHKTMVQVYSSRCRSRRPSFLDG